MDDRIGDRLSFQDVAFLNFDRDQFPYNVGSVGIFEGEIPFEDYVPHIDRRLDMVRRYRQRVVPVPLDLAQPEWFDDPEFNIENHVSLLDLPAPHDEEALRRVAGEFFATPLNRERPLWEMILVRGLTGGRTAQLAKVHHCMIDGVSGVELLAALLDIKPLPPKGPRPRPKAQPPGIPGRIDRAVDALFDRALDQIDMAEGIALNLADPIGTLMKVGGTVRALLPVRRHVSRPRGRTPWRAALESPTGLSWARMPLDETKAIAKRLGGKVNDVVLSVLAAAMSHYLEAHGLETEGLTVRVAVPVNVRRAEEERMLGNRVSFMLVGLPMGEMNPLERFAAVRDDAAAMKQCNQAGAADSVMGILGSLPPAFQHTLGKRTRMPNIVADLICTNVPGPPIPLYCMGHRMLEHHPWVPLGWRMGLGVAVMSYDDGIDFSFTADRTVDVDLEQMAELLEEAAADLLAAAGSVKTDEAVEIPAHLSTREEQEASRPTDARATLGAPSRY